MKFKILAESFGYDQAGIDLSRATKDKLEEFINELEVIENAYECITDEELTVLDEAIEILDSFHTKYKALASRKLQAYYNKKKDV